MTTAIDSAPVIKAVRAYADWIWANHKQLAGCDERAKTKRATQRKQAATCLKTILGRAPTDDEVSALAEY